MSTLLFFVLLDGVFYAEKKPGFAFHVRLYLTKTVLFARPPPPDRNSNLDI